MEKVQHRFSLLAFIYEETLNIFFFFKPSSFNNPVTFAPLREEMVVCEYSATFET